MRGWTRARKIGPWAIGLLLGLEGGASTALGQGYLTCYALGNPLDSGALFRIDWTEYTSVRVGDTNGVPISQLAATPDGRLFAINQTSDWLLELDPASGAVLQTVTFDRDAVNFPRGLAISPDGVFYAVFAGPMLYQVDEQTGVTTLIGGTTGATMIESLAFMPDGRLFASGRSSGTGSQANRLFELDLATGATLSNTLLPVPDIDMLTGCIDGFLYGINQGEGDAQGLLRIDPTTGATEDIGDPGIGIDVAGLAFDPRTYVCSADITDDGYLDTRDVLLFLGAWVVGAPHADWNQDGSVNTIDVVLFLGAWAAGW